MKKFISCVVLLVGMCVNSQADICPIILYQEYNNERNIDNRSLSICLTASYDNHIIYLSSEKFFNVVTIQVTDEDNNIVYEETTALIPGQTHSFAFEPTSSKTYKIVIETEELECHGEFVLTE